MLGNLNDLANFGFFVIPGHFQKNGRNGIHGFFLLLYMVKCVYILIYVDLTQVLTLWMTQNGHIE
jgi:hypothetical protein